MQEVNSLEKGAKAVLGNTLSLLTVFFFTAHKPRGVKHLDWCVVW